MSSAVRELETVQARAPAVSLSVIVPVTERCDDLVEIYRAFAPTVAKHAPTFEFLFVIDGWFEEAARPLQALVAAGEPIRVVQLPRQFGEAVTLSVGFSAAGGETILTLPAYFQTTPDAVDAVLMRLGESTDLVVARRWPRRDPWINRLQNRAFHWILRQLAGVRLHDISCGVKVMRRRVAREVSLYGDLHRFLPILARRSGFQVVEVDVPQHPADVKPRPQRLGTYLRRLLDIVTVVFLVKFTRKPLRFFGLVGLGLFGSGAVLSAYLAAERLFGGTPLADRPLLVLAMVLMVLGVQVGSIGLLGEMLIFTHARKMREYAVRNVLRS